MDKSQFETYEFFPVNTEGPEQFFVVQDDGTYLINRQVQYVTQVEDVKTVLDGQSCTVYDVSEVAEQPFFVDVDNSSELMSVSDQFVLPDASSNLYANSYLLQPSTTADEVKEDVPEVELKPSTSTLGVDLGTSEKPVNSYIEITLTDDQYQKLEQKGYLLLELSDKVYVLDSLGGLRDITSNEKLIQKLKIDDQNWNKSVGVKVENNLNTLASNQSLSSEPETLEFVITSDIAQNGENIGPLIVNNTNKDNVPQAPSYVNQEIKIAPLVNSVENNAAAAICSTSQNIGPCNDVKVFLVESEKEEEQNSKNIIKIKTKLSLKDIPDKIVLGKTTNGKTLVARVKKTEQTPQSTNKPNDVDIYLKKSVRAVFDPEDMLFPDLIKEAIRNPEQSISSKDLQALDMIITQLIQVPSFHPALDGDNYLFITKVIKTESEKRINKSKPIIWTGRVKMIEHEWRFEHLPYILQNLLLSDEYKTGSSIVIHIQILEEVRRDTNVVKTSVTVNKKQLLPGRPKKKDTVYACSACAAVFSLEQELKIHQEEYLHTVDTSAILTMDMDTPIETEYNSLSGDKYYACTQCNAKFTRLNQCKNHMKIHGFNTTNEDGLSNEDPSKKKPNNVIYRCNMCPNTYFHPSTLTKHIMSKHVKINI